MSARLTARLPIRNIRFFGWCPTRVLLSRRAGFRHEVRFGGGIDHRLGGSRGSARIRSV